ncbi:hypothetical protein [Conexibacter arvalis]|uniref:PadR family transcriptional regulator n=1 Tax=Conexibacter arvalis TaxID=912552 RepID=A0A840I7F9_9ACTN|nr:hypothetical protein [Conexibacter arvalis]MBB4660797.1 hypothetical protein [Conexibacter arvalis]
MGHGESLVRNAVLAQIVLSELPMTRNAIGMSVATRYAVVFSSWQRQHAYEHVAALRRAELVMPADAGKPARYRATAAGVAAWRAWLVSPIEQRLPVRDALTRLHSTRAGDHATMLRIVDLCEERLCAAAEGLRGPQPGADLVQRLARDALRTRIVAELQWCQDARDGIAEQVG